MVRIGNIIKAGLMFPFIRFLVLFIGIDEANDGKRTLHDKMRMDYFRNHLLYVQRAMR